LSFVLCLSFLEWEQQVEQRGKKEGRKEGVRSLVMRLLSRHFGEIPSAIQTQIEQLDLNQTEALAEALLDFTSLDDLQNWLQQH
jgi:predicted transposase YdaD